MKKTLAGAKRIAMEFSPNNAIPYISRVDAGTVDFIRSLQIEVISSGDILPYFTAVLDRAQADSHLRAARGVEKAVPDAWQWISDHLKKKKTLTEYDVQQKILADYGKMSLITEDPLIVAANAHSADPHYAPQKGASSPIRPDDFVLIDIWGKENTERAVYGDITRVAVAASRPTDRQQEIFSIVRRAQKAATDLVRSRFEQKKRIEGWEVDDAARSVIRDAGYGTIFYPPDGPQHRNESSWQRGAHGQSGNPRHSPILPGTCFSIEPGIYLPGEFGVRLEYDLYIHPDGKVEITGGVQDEIVCLL